MSESRSSEQMLAESSRQSYVVILLCLVAICQPELVLIGGDSERVESKEDWLLQGWLSETGIFSGDEVIHVWMRDLWFSSRSCLQGHQEWQRMAMNFELQN